MSKKSEPMELTFTDEARPTRGGRYIAYRVEYRVGDEKWRPISLLKNAKLQGGAPAGVPSAFESYPVNHMFRLNSWNEAVALAYWTLAEYEAQGELAVDIRLVPCLVVYDVKIYESNKVMDKHLLEGRLNIMEKHDE